MTSRAIDRGWDRGRFPVWALVVGGIVTGAVLPAVVALVLFVSVAVHRPVLARTLPAGSSVTPARLTVAWGLGLALIAVVQAAGAVLGMGSIASPGGMAARTGFGLAVEAVLLAATAAYLRVPSRRLG